MQYISKICALKKINELFFAVKFPQMVWLSKKKNAKFTVKYST